MRVSFGNPCIISKRGSIAIIGYCTSNYCTSNNFFPKWPYAVLQPKISRSPKSINVGQKSGIYVFSAFLANKMTTSVTRLDSLPHFERLRAAVCINKQSNISPDKVAGERLNHYPHMTTGLTNLKLQLFNLPPLRVPTLKWSFGSNSGITTNCNSHHAAWSQVKSLGHVCSPCGI